MLHRNLESPEPRLYGSAVCAVLVSYHPDPELPARLSRMAPQVGAIVIVDNGSADAELRMLRELAADPRIHLIPNLENLGVARALNLGVQRAVVLGYSLALLLDQDTRAEDDMVETLLGIYASFTPRDRLAVIGSNWLDGNPCRWCCLRVSLWAWSSPCTHGPLWSNLVLNRRCPRSSRWRSSTRSGLSWPDC